MAVSTAPPTSAELEELRARLTSDEHFPFYAKTCLKIVNKSARVVPFVLNEPQRRLHERLMAQKAAGRPMRAIILKSRQIGFSTETQAMLVHRCTTKNNRRALVVAHEGDVAEELWSKADLMYSMLPTDLGHGISVKPQLTARERGEYLAWGEPGRALQQIGAIGLNSSYRTATANSAEGGRGFTFTDLHLSEVAFWGATAGTKRRGGASKKMTAVLSAVPDDPDTLVILESTANGANFFKSWWERAERGESEYIPFFAGWLEDPSCSRPFLSEVEREQFISDIGNGPLGEAEPQLVELFGVTPEQLYWRQTTIRDKCEGKVEIFNQEYPTTAEEAFILSGEHVFSTIYIQRAIEQARRAPEPELGVLRVTKVKEGVKARVGTVDVPLEVEFVPKSKLGFGANHPYWHVFELPKLDRDYVVALDPMGGELNDEGEPAYHAIQVIDHVSREQVARYKSRIDPDLVGMEALYAAIFYNRAWLAPETTGGYGGAIARRLYEDFKYPFTYRKKQIDILTQRSEKKIGWDTTTKTKPWLEETMMELLREGTHGIVDLVTALELSTYVRDERGKTGPAEGAFSDCLMAYMIAQFVAREKPLKRNKNRDSVAGASS